MLLRWPNGLDVGDESHEMVYFSDWFPTLLALTGVERPGGFAALPALRGESGATCTRRFWQWNRYTPIGSCNGAMRDGDWKLVRPNIAGAMAVPCVDP